jgi:O-antigen/teichoic acid export membrane protein
VRLNRYEIIVNTITTAIQLTIIYFDRTVWSLVFGLVVGSVVSMVGSYFLVPGISHKLTISGQYVRQIFGFSKWIFFSSMMFFLANSFDRLYLGGAVPLALLGIYGLARTINDMLVGLASRLGNLIVFPLISSFSQTSREELRHHLGPLRMQFLLAVAVGIAILAANGDLAIRLIYDQRYQAAGWMLPILLVGAWFSVVSSLNDAMLLGFGKPLYSAIANGIKLGCLAVGLPVSFAKFGLPGALLAIVGAEIGRYAALAAGQLRERFSFAGQDAAATCVFLGCALAMEWIRRLGGFGTSFDHLPLELVTIFSMPSWSR